MSLPNIGKILSRHRMSNRTETGKSENSSEKDNSRFQKCKNFFIRKKELLDSFLPSAFIDKIGSREQTQQGTSSQDHDFRFTDEAGAPSVEEELSDAEEVMSEGHGSTHESGPSRFPDIERMRQEQHGILMEDHRLRMKMYRRKMEQYFDSSMERECQSSSSDYKEEGRDFYIISEKKFKGLCVIVKNTKKYTRLADKLQRHFVGIGYEMELCSDLDYNEMDDFFSTISQRNFSEHGCYISFVLESVKYERRGTDAEQFTTLQNIVNYFSPDRTASLAGKPKIFIFQTDISILEPSDILKWEDNGLKYGLSLGYDDAILFQSTHRDFAEKFGSILMECSDKSLDSVVSVLRKEMIMTNINEQWVTTSRLKKEVYLSCNPAMPESSKETDLANAENAPNMLTYSENNVEG